MMTMLTLWISLWSAPVLAQDAVDQAYQREYAYLAAEKRALSARLSALDGEATRAQTTVESDIARLEVALKRAESARGDTQDALEARERAAMGDDESRMILDATISQAAESIAVDVDEAALPETNFAFLLEQAASTIAVERSITSQAGSFFLPDGIQLKGEIVRVGQVAAFGIADGAAGPLRPIGDGKYQLKGDVPGDSARALLAGESLSNVGLFLFEGAQNRVEEPTDRSATETVEAGGIVAWIIVGLGFLALVLAAIRSLLLGTAGAALQRDERWLGTEGQVSPVVPASLQGPLSTALTRVQSLMSNGDRESIFDAAEEGMSNDRNRLERFSTVIMVIAAVAPLLGLLGTVTGMIATFAIITEHGTGDPRMLSGGISEALITTQLGLIVAIPALLIGNILSGWSKALQGRIEQGVLVYVNTHTPRSTPSATVVDKAAPLLPPAPGLSQGENVVA